MHTATTEPPEINPMSPNPVQDWKALVARFAALPEERTDERTSGFIKIPSFRKKLAITITKRTLF